MQALLILETLTRLWKAKEILVVKMGMMTIVLEKDSKYKSKNSNVKIAFNCSSELRQRVRKFLT